MFIEFIVNFFVLFRFVVDFMNFPLKSNHFMAIIACHYHLNKNKLLLSTIILNFQSKCEDSSNSILSYLKFTSIIIIIN